MKKDGSSGGFVYSSAFHSDKPVFHQVDPPDSVFPGYLVELADDFGRRMGFPSMATQFPFSKVNSRYGACPGLIPGPP